MEYEDAPSGFVTLYRYKEPFMRYTQGYGYLGALLFDGKTQKIQCHECGDWFYYLPDHLHREHNMRASEYKERVGLRQTSALISEVTRNKLVASGTERFKNLRPGKKKTQKEKDKIRKTMQKVTMEAKNERGTCPEQLIDRLLKLHDKYGRMPTEIEGKNLFRTIREVYGSMERACEIAGIQHRKNGLNLNHHSQYFKFTDEQLLQLIRDFTARHGRPPSTSDLKRKLLPGSYSLYRRRFGSMPKARKAAFKKSK